MFNFKVIIITFKLLPVFVTLMDKLVSIFQLNIITYNPLHKFTEFYVGNGFSIAAIDIIDR